jgi:hypothetical protein
MLWRNHPRCSSIHQCKTKANLTQHGAEFVNSILLRFECTVSFSSLLLLKPMDRLFDFMLDTTKLPHPDDLMFVDKPAYAGRNTNVTIPKRLDLLYTTDYYVVEAGREIKAVQGGFVMLRPNMTMYEDFLAIIREGDFRVGGDNGLGWGGLTGRFWGGMYH